MPSADPTAESSGIGSPIGFATTHWSLVLAAGNRDSPQSRDALAALCATYWYPLYVFIRRQGYDASQAEDLTQEFFARLLEKDFLGVVDPEKGKFRSFLRACVRHFLANEQDKPRAQKRGGGRPLHSLDFPNAEQRYRLEPCDVLTPGRLYDCQWALTLLDQVLARLHDEWHQNGRDRLFESVKMFLTGEDRTSSYEQVARALGMRAGAVKVAVHRLRGGYRELIREEIARIVDDPAEVDDEIRNLFAALG
jgi:RNA polymerase sigma factor (sigma-70 family)